MQRNEMFDIVKERIRAVVTEVPPARPILEDTTWYDLRADALDVVMIISDVTKRMDVLVDHTELAGLQTLRDLLNLFERALEHKRAWMNHL